MPDLIDRKKLIEYLDILYEKAKGLHFEYYVTALDDVLVVIENQPKVNQWIPVEERLPETEEEVFVLTARGTRTTAIYEDGTMREDDSMWHWYNIGGEWEWDEEKDCYIIPKGWWEYRHFNPDDVYNNAIDVEVIAWMPLPELTRKIQKMLKNKSASDSLYFLHSLAKKDTEFETQTEAFQEVYDYIKQLENALDEACEELESYDYHANLKPGHWGVWGYKKKEQWKNKFMNGGKE